MDNDLAFIGEPDSLLSYFESLGADPRRLDWLKLWDCSSARRVAALCHYWRLRQMGVPSDEADERVSLLFKLDIETVRRLRKGRGYAKVRAKANRLWKLQAESPSIGGNHPL